MLYQSHLKSAPTACLLEAVLFLYDRQTTSQNLYGHEKKTKTHAQRGVNEFYQPLWCFMGLASKMPVTTRVTISLLAFYLGSIYRILPPLFMRQPLGNPCHAIQTNKLIHHTLQYSRFPSIFLVPEKISSFLQNSSCKLCWCYTSTIAAAAASHTRKVLDLI